MVMKDVTYDRGHATTLLLNTGKTGLTQLTDNFFANNFE